MPRLPSPVRRDLLWDHPLKTRVDDPLCFEIRKRLREKRNTMTCCVGEPRCFHPDEQIPYLDLETFKYITTENISSFYSKFHMNPSRYLSVSMSKEHKLILAQPSDIVKVKLPSTEKLYRIYIKGNGKYPKWSSRYYRTMTGSSNHTFIIRDVNGIREINGSDLRIGMKIPTFPVKYVQNTFVWGISRKLWSKSGGLKKATNTPEAQMKRIASLRQTIDSLTPEERSKIYGKSGRERVWTPEQRENTSKHFKDVWKNNYALMYSNAVKMCLKNAQNNIGKPLNRSPEISEYISRKASNQMKKAWKENYDILLKRLIDSGFFENATQSLVDRWIVDYDAMRDISIKNLGKFLGANEFSPFKRMWKENREYMMTITERGRRRGFESMCKNRYGTIGSKHMSGLEEKFDSLVTKNNLPFFYTGNSWDYAIGSKIKGFHIPDFTHKTLPIVVEVLGEYWHASEDEQKLISFYESFGYRCIIFWGKNLGYCKEKNILKKLADTNGNPTSEGGFVCFKDKNNTEPDWVSIMKIEEIPMPKYVYDITVPNHETFMNRDGIVVHNSGKTWSQITLGENNDQSNRYDPGHFDPSHIAFLPQDYIDKLRKFKPGCYVEFDEPGAEWSSRRFMSITNLLLGATHITMGSRLINVGWAVPVLKMQDINAARLLRYFFIMETTGPRGIARFYQNWVSEYTGKTGRTQLGMVWFAKPWQDHPEYIKEYEQAKKDYQDTSYEEYYIKFEEDQNKKQTRSTISEAEVNEIMKKIKFKPEKYTLNGRIRVELIEAEEDIKGIDAKRISIMAKKWYEVKKLKDEAKNIQVAKDLLPPSLDD